MSSLDDFEIAIQKNDTSFLSSYLEENGAHYVTNIRSYDEKIIFACAEKNVSPQTLKILFDAAVKHGSMKALFEYSAGEGYDSSYASYIGVGAQNKLHVDCFRLIVEYCLAHASCETLTKMIEKERRNPILGAINLNLNRTDSFFYLLRICDEYSDLKKLLAEESHVSNQNCTLQIKEKINIPSLLNPLLFLLKLVQRISFQTFTTSSWLYHLHHLIKILRIVNNNNQHHYKRNMFNPKNTSN